MEMLALRGNLIVIYTYQSNMLHTLTLPNVTCQLYLN